MTQQQEQIVTRRSGRLKNTLGLVVCGGESKRMGHDKSQISYHGKPQYQVTQQILATFCKKTFISCRNEQQALFEISYGPLLFDLPEYAGSGPISGILSAHHRFPESDLLVLGCDYPLMTETEFSIFVSQLDEKTAVHVFYNQAGFFEPLIGWYTAAYLKKMKIWYQEGQLSLQQMLRQSTAARYSPHDKTSITSVDTPEQAERIRLQLASR